MHGEGAGGFGGTPAVCFLYYCHAVTAVISPSVPGGAMTSLPNVSNVHCALNDGTCAAVFSALASP